jgi:hypothetical protein
VYSVRIVAKTYMPYTISMFAIAAIVSAFCIQEAIHLVDTLQIGRKLTHKRQVRRLISRAVQQFSAANTQTPTAKPKSGDLAALIQEFRDEAARMTPEEIAAEDAAFANVEFTRFSLPIPDVSDHD